MAGHRWQYGACALHDVYLRLYTHSGCVILIVCPLQQWLEERVLMLVIRRLNALWTVELRPNAGHGFFLRFLDHKQRHNTIGRAPLNEWSARRRDLDLTTHNTHNRQISMLRLDSNPQSQQANGRRPTRLTSRPLASACMGNVWWILTFCWPCISVYLSQ